MTTEEARQLLATDPDRWREVWGEIKTQLAAADIPEGYQGKYGGLMREAGKVCVETAANLVSLLGTVAGGEDGPDVQDVVDLYVLCLRKVFGADWFDWLWKQTPMKRISDDPGWYKLGDGGVPYALLHTECVTIRRTGLVEAKVATACPPLPTIPILGGM